MTTVLDVGGGFFKRQILHTSIDIQITDRRCWIAAVSKTICSNSHGGCGRDGIGNQPTSLVKTGQYLVLAPKKDDVDGVTCRPRFGIRECGIGGKIKGIRIPPNACHKCCKKHDENTQQTHCPDDESSQNSSLLGNPGTLTVRERFLLHTEVYLRRIIIFTFILWSCVVASSKLNLHASALPLVSIGDLSLKIRLQQRLSHIA